jgi:hypothetical protein
MTTVSKTRRVTPSTTRRPVAPSTRVRKPPKPPSGTARRRAAVSSGQRTAGLQAKTLSNTTLRRTLPSDRVVWGTTGSLTAFVDRNGFRFSAVLNFVIDEWMAVGFVVRIPTGGDPVEHALAEHAHQNLGVFSTLDGEDGAQLTALRFLLLSAVPPSMCGCEAVEATDEPCAETERAT